MWSVAEANPPPRSSLTADSANLGAFWVGPVGAARVDWVVVLLGAAFDLVIAQQPQEVGVERERVEECVEAVAADPCVANSAVRAVEPQGKAGKHSEERQRTGRPRLSAA